jgi:hypothetical protein
MWDVCQTAVFEDWWCELGEQEQDDVTAIVELLQEMGPQLPFPHSSGVEGSRHSHRRELRIQSHGDPLRVFYAFAPRRTRATTNTSSICNPIPSHDALLL